MKILGCICPGFSNSLLDSMLLMLNRIYSRFPRKCNTLRHWLSLYPLPGQGLQVKANVANLFEMTINRESISVDISIHTQRLPPPAERVGNDENWHDLKQFSALLQWWATTSLLTRQSILANYNYQSK